ncbi:hypothetical protein KA005_28805 [bacterium]|nr:hypothetical protein [bacterium]
MLKSKALISGKLTVTVFGSDGEIKRFEPRWWEKLLGLPGRKMQMTNHNIVTDEGDALIADLMQQTPERTKVDNTNGKIGVGTGWVSTTKATDALVTQEGSDEEMDATYPITEGDWAAADDNVVQYRATFEAGDLDATGIDEALLGNGTDTLAYAQITPAVDVGLSDTLQVDWELTLLGA